MALVSTVKRDSITILADILKAVSLSSSTRKMSIVYKANLNFERINKFLNVLTSAGLVNVLDSAGGHESYSITPKGREFLAGYARLVEALQALPQYGRVGVISKSPLASPV